MTLVFTICSNNYLAQAFVLGDSLLKHNTNYKFIIGLVDNKKESKNTIYPHEIIEVENIGITCFHEMSLRYNIVELNTSVKPYFFKFLFEKYRPEKIIYLDPDIEVFAPFSELEYEMEDNDILITPHFTTPIDDDKWQAEEDFLNSGLYNLGFIAIKGTENGFKMIEWWANRLKNKAFIDFKRGLFTDQIWINFVPLFFKKVKIFCNAGYNVAYWNLHERVISKNDNYYFVNVYEPLVFYHFASYRPLDPDKISTGQTRFTFLSRPDITELFDSYRSKLFDSGYSDFARCSCIYTDMKRKHDDEVISRRREEIPKYKRALGKMVRWAIREFDLVMDYSKLK